MSNADHAGPSVAVLLVLLVSASTLNGLPDSCTHKMVGDPKHYFNDYDEVVFNASCGYLCPLPLPEGLRNITSLKVYFPQNSTTETNCSWLTPDLGTPNMSLVMFFEPSSTGSLAFELLCGESAVPSLTLWDQYSLGGEVQTTYTICRDPNRNEPQTYSRWSSRLGSSQTLISLSGYPVRPENNPMLLKYIVVDWANDCKSQDYKQVVVDASDNTTALGSQWLTSKLRFPNGMHCKWQLSTSNAFPIRLRITVLDSTPVPGPCQQDDTLTVQTGAHTENLTLCEGSGPYFIFSKVPISIDFSSGSQDGAPEWKMMHSALSTCPQNRLILEADVTENVMYGMLQTGQNPSLCHWTLQSNWSSYAVMVTRVELTPNDCSPGSVTLSLDLGSGAPKIISLCQISIPSLFPLWSLDVTLHVNLSLADAATRVDVFYKMVPKVPYCQGHVGDLEAVQGDTPPVSVDLSLQRTNMAVSAPDCRWLVHPAAQGRSGAAQENPEEVAEITVLGSGVFWQTNSTTAGWFISGFQAYAGDSVSASAKLKENCFFNSYALQCQYVSSRPTLLLVYNISQSTSPVPVDSVSLSARLVRKTSSGQTRSGSTPRFQHAQWLWVVGLVLEWRKLVAVVLG